MTNVTGCQKPFDATVELADAELTTQDIDITPEEQAAWEEDQLLAAADEMKQRRRDIWDAWPAADLFGVDTTTPVEWVPGAERIIRKGERQMWFASEGNGKTQAALHLVAQVCKDGGCVAYVDVENDAREMAERLQPIAAAFGATDAVREKLLYLPDLPLPPLVQEEAAAQEFAKLLTTIDLFVIDSLTRVLASFGIDEDSNKDVARFMRELPDQLKACGIATLILDNTGHNPDHVRGARSKTALIETAYRVTGGKDVRADEHGTLTLKLERSRSGKVAKWITAGSGGGNFDKLTPREGSAPKSGAGTKASERQAAIAERLRQEPERYFTVKELEAKFGVARNTITKDMEKLVDAGDAEQAADGNKWKSRR
ncbi:MAG: AAA family ATPase [Solirubrobacteraceae bacterium]